MAINTMRELRGYTDFQDAPTPLEGPLSEDQARLLRHGYLASVSYMDAQVGRLLDTLDKLDLTENTIVVLWGDHGWKLGEHRSWCKMTNYEIDTRVPLIVRVPGAKQNGHACSRLAEFVDIYPTLCHAARLPLPEHLEGISLVPLLEDRQQPWKKAIFTQFLREGIWMTADGIPYMGYAIRTDRYRFVRWVNWDTREEVACELYDQHADSAENRNIVQAVQNRGIVAELRQRLEAGWRSAARLAARPEVSVQLDLIVHDQSEVGHSLCCSVPSVFLPAAAARVAIVSRGILRHTT